jgi:hypothetical protein
MTMRAVRLRFGEVTKADDDMIGIVTGHRFSTKKIFFS